MTCQNICIGHFYCVIYDNFIVSYPTFGYLYLKSIDFLGEHVFLIIFTLKSTFVFNNMDNTPVSVSCFANQMIGKL